MELWGENSGLSGGSTQSSPLSAASLQTSFITPNSYGLPIQSNSNSQIAIQFDAATGWLAIAGNSANNIVKQTITGNGYYQFDIDGQLFSSDRSSASYWQSLEGATRDSLTGINFDGGLGYDTLIVGSQEHINNFGAIADDTIQIQGEVYGESLFFKAKDIINQGSIIAGNVTAEFSNSYIDDVDAKIIATNGGNILLNGGKTGDLEATGQFLATGLTGGKIDFRAKTVSLRGSNLDASGENGGGKILIGGDYQGVNSIDSPSLANAESTFVDKHSKIDAGAKNNGNGGKVIIWADIDTDFRGDIKVRGGNQSGDGGFVEVSGKRDLNFVGNVDVDAPNGAIGSVLLDPEDIIINPDDDNDATFDVSNLQSIIGDLALSATNSIILNANIYLQPVRGTVTFQAGGTVALYGYLWAGIHDINITAGSIIANERGAIFSNPYSGNGRSGSINLVSQREIDFGQTTIFAESNSNSGNITLTAGTTINAGFMTTFGKNRGGNVKLTANGDIFTSSIRTFSASGKGGNISIVSTNGSIKATNIDPYDSNGTSLYTIGLDGNGGSVTLEAYGDIITNEIITTSANNGNGGTVKLTSQTGRITHGGQILTHANNGNAGNVTLKSVADIKVGDIVSNSRAGVGVVTNGGNIAIATVGNVESGNITTASNAGNAGYIKITAGSLTELDKKIKVGDLVASSDAGGDVAKTVGIVSLKASGNIEAGSITTSSQNGAAGNVKVEAGGDILTGAIASNTFAGSGKGGNITLDGKNINAESLRADSVGADGGQIRLTADKFIQITGSTLVNGKDYSIFTDSKDVAPSSNDTGARSAPILIRHSQKVRDESLTPFIVGDSSKNGTARSISDGIVDFWVSSGNTRKVYDFDFQFNDIYIKRPFALLADISNILGIPGVTILKKDSDIINNILKFSPYIPALDIQSISNSVVSLLSRISKQELVNLGLGIQKADLDKYYSYLITAMAISGINSVDNQAHFLAQLLSESQRFLFAVEQGDYNYFESIYGNTTATGRELGNTSLGDGANYRGRGLIQVTGKDVYKRFGKDFLGLENTFVANPDLIGSEPIFAVLVSTWYWTSNFKSNVIPVYGWTSFLSNTVFSTFKEIAEDSSFPNNVVSDITGDESDRVERITRIINPGYRKLDERKEIFSKIRPALNN
jgi:predicted chitinase